MGDGMSDNRTPDEPDNGPLTIKVCDGKYTFVKSPGDYRISILRYDEPWLVIEQGSNAICALLREYADTLATLKNQR